MLLLCVCSMEGMQKLKIATWNVNSVRFRLPLVTRFLRDEQPDVLCLQETKVQDHEFPVDAFRDAGYHAGLPLGRWYPKLADCVSVAVTEKRAKAEIGGLAAAMRKCI